MCLFSTGLFGISLSHLARFLFALVGYLATCNYFTATHLRPNGFVSGSYLYLVDMQITCSRDSCAHACASG